MALQMAPGHVSGLMNYNPWGSGGGKQYLNYLQGYNASAAGPAASAFGSLQNRLASDYGNYIQGWNNVRNNITAGNIAQLQDTGQTTRTGMQTASNEKIAEGDYGTRRYEADKRLSGQQYQSDINKAIAELQANANVNIADLTTGRQLEGTKYHSDAQTEQARIGIQPQMEALSFARDKWGDVFPFLKETVAGLTPQNTGDAAPAAPIAVPDVGAGLNTDALVNNANRAAYQAYAEGGQNELAALGGRGFTAAGSENTLRSLENQRRMGLANQLSNNAVGVPLEVASVLAPLQLQAAGLREGGRAARAQEAISRQRIGQDFVTALLGLVGGLAG